MKRWLVIGYVGSFLIFAAFPVFRFDRSLRVLSHMTDHASHWGAALLLAEHGAEVYRRPTGELCEPTTPEERVPQPAWNCRLRGNPSVRPFTVNWPQYPRVYPPGAMLWGAPEATLFGLSWIDYGQANLLMVLSVLAAAHLASLLLLLGLWTEDRTWQSVVLFLLLPLFHLSLVEASLRGIYDPVAIAALIGSIRLFTQGRVVAAVAAISVAEFTHFRALWYLPLLLALLGLLFQQRAAWSSSRRAVGMVVASSALLLLAAVCFLLVLPAMRTFHLTNPFGWKAFTQEPGLVFTDGVPVIGVLAVLARNRNWLTLSVVAWQLFMLLQTREVQPWHALFLLPLFALAAREKQGARAAVVAVVLLFLWEARVVFSGWPLSGEIIPTLLGT